MQKHISPVTVSFIYILEPVLGAIFANLYLHETLPPLGYLGGGLVFIGAMIHTTGIALPSKARYVYKTVSPSRRQQSKHPLYGKPIALFIAFMLFLGAEFALLYNLGGFPPRAWLDLYTLWPTLATLAQNGQTSYVILLWVQAICWLVAWLTSILMALLIVSYLAGKMQPAQAEENLALRHYFSQEDTMIMPVIPALPTMSQRYPLHPVSPVEEIRERVLVEEFLREYL
jgi:hypothetical protein